MKRWMFVGVLLGLSLFAKNSTDCAIFLTGMILLLAKRGEE